MNKLILVVLELIVATGEQGIPDGHLYMLLQERLGEKWTLETHQSVVAFLVRAKAITNEHHLLCAVKP